jgi:hypothetical protein
MKSRSVSSARSVFLLLCGVLFLGVALVVMAVNVCNKCGYEIVSGVENCGHCGAKAVQEAAKPANLDAGSNVLMDAQGFLADSVVESEVSEARKNAKTKGGAVAVLFLRNAIALDMITSGAGHEGRGMRILGMIRDYQAEVSMATRECSACGGSGRATVIMSGLDGKTKEMAGTAKRCEACDGKQMVAVPLSAADLRLVLAQATSQYTDMQKARRYVPVGNAWVPLDLEGRLTVKQMALIKRAAAAPCGGCLGPGRQLCKQCFGYGRLRCTNSRCNKGLVREQEMGTLVKGTMTKTVRCPTCRGAGKLTCATCQGKGQVLCADCGGTGDRPVCARCDGSGMLACARCKGEGTVSGKICAVCAGRKAVLCDVCKGDGRKKTE